MFKEYLGKIIADRNSKKYKGIVSYCISNPLAIKAILKHEKSKNRPVLFEATSNQVNQYGGYTGLNPLQYKERVIAIANNLDFPIENLRFGGDHLGPLPFSNLYSDEAMSMAEKMVFDYVSAGFDKIHLDTSMYLGGDDKNIPLSTEVIASRGAVLMKTAINAFNEYKKYNEGAEHPVFVIGSEVPPAGGHSSKAGDIEITKAGDVFETIDAYDKAFKKEEIDNAWKNVIAVVVQPGVEFGNNDVAHYSRKNAFELMSVLNGVKNIVYEGHSTDYQTAINLREMVEDGVVILKVGPLITASLREALLNLEGIEKNISEKNNDQSRFSEILFNVMKESPKNWERYYIGSEFEVNLSLKYSLLDRSRYYLDDARVMESIDKLFANLNGVHIPVGLVRQFFPMQYFRLNDSEFYFDILMNDYIASQIEAYDFAIN